MSTGCAKSVMSNEETEQLRDGIRSGTIACECRVVDRETYEHEPGCYWDWALLRIYEVERKLESEVGTP